MLSHSPELGVCYYPEHWPEDRWAIDAAHMAKMGLTLVRIGEFAWSRIEPQEGDYDWAWLDRAIDTLGAAGLKVILGTPTATPPRWMLTKFPDMIAHDKDGKPRTFGSRRHYCFSHAGYKRACVRIAADMAKRYADHSALYAWQTDNEYGCHETTVSYSPHALKAFRLWLEKRYVTIDALNDAWGNIFWSMEYGAFTDIALPHMTVTEANPSHVMDFRRFSSDQVKIFNQVQCHAIGEHSVAPLIHNYMGRILDFDHFDVGEELDIASWDSYPLGFLEDRSDQGEAHKRAYMRQGDPDFQALHHDLYRAVGKGRWGIMEQQPGPVNWAPHNPAPLPGMVRLWSWEAIAHGAEFVNYFRWRQAPFAQEQMHAGLLRVDGMRASVCDEIEHVAKEISALNFPETTEAPVAIVFDYASAWAWDIQPQGESFNYFRLVLDIYRALRQQGQSVDILPPTTRDFGARKLVLIPGLFTWTPQLRRAMIKFKGHMVVGPRTGSKTSNFHIPQTLPPELPGLDIKVIYAESLRPDAPVTLEAGGAFKFWHEQLETSEHVMERTASGQPALVAVDKTYYLAGWPDQTALHRILSSLSDKSGLTRIDLPEGVRVRDFGPYRLFTNYNAQPVRLPFVRGGSDIAPAGVILINHKTHETLVR